jgi:hypothetical protein
VFGLHCGPSHSHGLALAMALASPLMAKAVVGLGKSIKNQQMVNCYKTYSFLRLFHKG